MNFFKFLMEINTKKKDYRNHSKKLLENYSNKVNKLTTEKNILKQKTIETEEKNVETVNTSEILDRIEKEKTQIGFSLERLDNIENSKVIGELDVNISSRRAIVTTTQSENTIENQETNNNEKQKEKVTWDNSELIKFIIILFLVGIVFLIILINID